MSAAQLSGRLLFHSRATGCAHMCVTVIDNAPSIMTAHKGHYTEKQSCTICQWANGRQQAAPQYEPLCHADVCGSSMAAILCLQESKQCSTSLSHSVYEF